MNDQTTEPQPLSEAERAAIAELIQQRINLEGQIQGMIRLMTKMRGLNGVWNIEGDQLVPLQMQQPMRAVA
jgi:hypothetical protein